MADVTNSILSLNEIKETIESNAVEGTLLLVDLVGSTAYKTRNGEYAWLSRLIDFIECVKRGLAPLRPSKYLGDGVLGFYNLNEIQPRQLVEIAKRIVSEVQRVNAERSYRAEHAIHIRIILSYGRIFLFEDGDPQGSAVDKLFRIEKYVPADCIGLTQEIVDKSECSELEQAGRYRLRGLAEGRHQLYLLNPPGLNVGPPLEHARRRAALYDIWDLGSDGEGKVHLISGYIPPEEGQPSTIQMGDKDAVLRAYKNLCLVGRLEDVEEMTSLDAREQHLRENVICIGGPFWNKVSLRFMREIHSPFIFDFSDNVNDRTPLIDCLTNAVYPATWNGSRLTKDVGFFGRFRNPFNPDRQVILVCGVETPAVAGVIRVFSEDQNDFMKLYEGIVRLGKTEDQPRHDLPDFFALFEFDVEYTGVAHIPAGEDQVRRVVFDWNSLGELRIQESPTE